VTSEMLKRIFSPKKVLLYVLVILVSYIATTAYFAPYRKAAKALTYYYGSRGDVIVEIQSRLKRWGYYTGTIDGVYGYQTFLAIKSFQEKNGLYVDGVAGNQTLVALGINIGNVSATNTSRVVDNQDLTLLARLINGEARGEPYEGQVAVGAVVLNRTRNPEFPHTVAGVIYQPGAFTAIVDGQINVTLEQASINAARDALNGWDPSGGAIYYFNPAKTTNQWIWSRPLIKVIGKHRFCR